MAIVSGYRCGSEPFDGAAVSGQPTGRHDEEMDNWEFAIGVVVALIGSVFAPWLKDSLQRRHLQQESNRSAVSKCLLRITAAAPDVALARVEAVKNAPVIPTESSAGSLKNLASKQFESYEAVFELGLLLSSRDAPMETMARLVINAAEENDFAVELICFTQAAARWYRKELSAKKALSSFESDVEKYRAMNLGLNALDIDEHGVAEHSRA